MVKQYQQSTSSGNETSLGSYTSAGDKDPNETVFDTRNGAIENVEGNVDISSRRFATHRDRKESNIANSCSSRRREIDEMELANLRAKREAEPRLREWQLKLEQEHEGKELRCRHGELRLQQQEDELRLRQHARALKRKLRLTRSKGN